MEPVREALLEWGVLLVQDKRLPSVVGIITGETLHMSWWSHPEAQEIFATLGQLSDDPDILFTKLLYRKETLVHRRLWSALLAVATAREPWQLEGLSTGARQLIDKLDQNFQPIRASGPVVKELTARLLANTQQVHTESGRHETVVEPWSVWSHRVGCAPVPRVSEGRHVLEQATLALGASVGALPWRAGALCQRLPTSGCTRARD